mmetsp:Transcript_45670/g.114922  ORF Transcript_45670/g.114922 Transcript_45670/m.114922 type:complete len:235 (+) Transcript_45670:910-1614(+)
MTSPVVRDTSTTFMPRVSMLNRMLSDTQNLEKSPCSYPADCTASDRRGGRAMASSVDMERELRERSRRVLVTCPSTRTGAGAFCTICLRIVSRRRSVDLTSSGDRPNSTSSASSPFTPYSLINSCRMHSMMDSSEMLTMPSNMDWSVRMNRPRCSSSSCMSDTKRGSWENHASWSSCTMWEGEMGTSMQKRGSGLAQMVTIFWRSTMSVMQMDSEPTVLRSRPAHWRATLHSSR